MYKRQSPEYLAFEKKLYEKTLRKLGFEKLLPEERAPQKDMAVSYTHLSVASVLFVICWDAV